MMVIRLDDMGHFEPLFTWVDDDGSNTQIASSRLRAWVLSHMEGLEVVEVPVEQEIANQYLNDNTVSRGRVLALTSEELAEPIIFCKRHTWSDESQDVYLVDGHHRYVRHAIDGIPFIAGWLLPVEQWEPFRVVASVNLTQDQLKRTGRFVIVK
jgi:hypothetical protein